LSSASKNVQRLEILTMLRDRRSRTGTGWLEHHFEHLGVRATVDLKKEFL